MTLNAKRVVGRPAGTLLDLGSIGPSKRRTSRRTNGDAFAWVASVQPEENVRRDAVVPLVKKQNKKNTVVETDSLQNVAVLLPTAAMRESGR